MIADGGGVATIVNDDAPAYLSVGDVVVGEGNSGTTPATFTITRSGNTTGSASVKYKTSGGNATPGVDYSPVGLSTVTFAPNQTTKTVSVGVIGDTGVEKNETFSLVLSAPTGAVLSDTTAVATIVDDDVAAHLSVDNVAAAEGNSGNTPLTFTVTRSDNTTGAATVHYATAGGNATAGTDYTAVSGTLAFAAGETTKTVTVNIAGDTVAEANETFNLVLSVPTGATLSDSTGTATIVNDD